MLSLILNILWLIFGGLPMAALWLLATVVMFVSIIGIPWGRACFNIFLFTLWPFGREAIDREDLAGRGDLGTGILGGVGNVLWLLVAGIWIAIGHVLAAIADALTIIGIPFAIQHLKLAGVALWPIGKAIVDKDVAAEARRRRAAGQVSGLRS
ncbi:MAG TPA: YccF domain-containing protein [Alphaproteobacteria bacterium]|nr:YccF domain-containing protein [Alphaproteobacteria bacterium]